VTVRSYQLLEVRTVVIGCAKSLDARIDLTVTQLTLIAAGDIARDLDGWSKIFAFFGKHLAK
jgi:hypothetical protein